MDIRGLLGVLAVWISAGGAVAQSDPVLTYDEDFYEARFEFLTRPDIAEMIGALQAANNAAVACRQDPECALQNCEALMLGAQQAAHYRDDAQALIDAVAHLHGRYADHLFSLQEEAVVAQDRVDHSAAVLVIQRYILRVGTMTLQLVTFASDVGSAEEAIGRGDLLDLINQADEIHSDLYGLQESFAGQREGLSPDSLRYVSQPTAFQGDLARWKSNLNNIRDVVTEYRAASGSAASGVPPAIAQNVLLIIGREAQAIADAEMARRQAEIEQMARDAHRERAEVEQFLDRTRALSLEVQQLQRVVGLAEQLRFTLASCAAGCDAPMLAAAPRLPPDLYEPDPANPGEVLLRAGAVDALVDQLRPGAGGLQFSGTDLDCDVEPNDGEVIFEAIPMPTPPAVEELIVDTPEFNPVPPGALDSCTPQPEDDRCRLNVPEVRAGCYAAVEEFAEACRAYVTANFTYAASFAPGSGPNPAAQRAHCEATCRFEHAGDRLADRYRTLAIEQVDVFAGADASPERQAWAEIARSYWTNFNSGQVMACGTEAVLTERLNTCLAQCATSPSARYQTCGLAERFNDGYVANLYPPGHPGREGLADPR